MAHPSLYARFAATFLAALPLLASAQDDPAVKELLEKLRSDRIEEREAAMPALIEKGCGIRSALLKAMESADFESRHRIQSVLDVLDTQYRPVAAVSLKKLWIFDMASGEKRGGAEAEYATCAAFSPDGRFVLVGLFEGGLRLFDSRSLKILASFPLEKGYARRVQFSEDGNSFLSIGEEVILWKR